MMKNKKMLTVLLLFPLMVVGIVFGCVATLTLFQERYGSPEMITKPQLDQNFGNLPLSFIPNIGQAQANVAYQVQALAGTLFFSPEKVVLALVDQTTETTEAAAPEEITQSEVELVFVNANPEPEITHTKKLPGKVNYFTGKDESNWKTNVETYQGISYQELYPGIDLEYDGTQSLLKGTYFVAPQVDPHQIVWQYKKIKNIEISSESGDLLITLPNGTVITERAPIAWQDINGTRRDVNVKFRLTADQKVSFVVGSYDATHELVLDPAIELATYLDQPNNGFTLHNLAVDDAGNIFIGGLGPYVAKLSADASTLLFVSYFGDNSGDSLYGLRLYNNRVYVTGYTFSNNFPMLTPYQSTFKGDSDIYISVLDAMTGNLTYSTYLGGSALDVGRALAADDQNNVYVTGITTSSDFPLQSAYQTTKAGSGDTFITKLNLNTNQLDYSTFLGGNGHDTGLDIEVDDQYEAVITGDSGSSDFPVTVPYTSSSIPKAFITKFSATGANLVSSSVIGGDSYSAGWGLTLDDNNNAYVVGDTSASNLPTVNAVQPIFGGYEDGFVAKINLTTGLPQFLTYWGGTGRDRLMDVSVAPNGNIYAIGSSNSIDLTTFDQLESPNGNTGVLLLGLSNDGQTLLLSSHFGQGEGSSLYTFGTGIFASADQKLYLTGHINADNLSTTPGVVRPQLNDNADSFLAKIDLVASVPASPEPSSQPVTPPVTTPVTPVEVPSPTPTASSSATPSSNTSSSVSTSNSSSSQNGTTSLAQAPVCTVNAPSAAPNNFRVVSSAANSVTLAWNSVAPATHYALVFRRLSDGASYGSTNIGSGTTYTINGISGSTRYSFEVFGVNDCAPGQRALLQSVNIGGQVLAQRPVGQDGQILGINKDLAEIASSATVESSTSADMTPQPSIVPSPAVKGATTVEPANKMTQSMLFILVKWLAVLSIVFTFLVLFFRNIRKK